MEAELRCTFKLRELHDEAQATQHAEPTVASNRGLEWLDDAFPLVQVTPPPPSYNVIGRQRRRWPP